MNQHHPRRARRAIIGIVASLAIVAAACGGDDDDDAADTAADTAEAPTQRRHRLPPMPPRRPAPRTPPAQVEGDAFEVAHFVAIQANPVEEVIIKTAQETADAAGDVNVTLFDANNDPAGPDRPVRGRDRLRPVRRVPAQGRRRPDDDRLCRTGARGRHHRRRTGQRARSRLGQHRAPGRPAWPAP